jgi:hypothetical protein
MAKLRNVMFGILKLQFARLRCERDGRNDHHCWGATKLALRSPLTTPSTPTSASLGRPAGAATKSMRMRTRTGVVAQVAVQAVALERRHAPWAAGTLSASASGGNPVAEAAAPAQHVDGQLHLLAGVRRCHTRFIRI